MSAFRLAAVLRVRMLQEEIARGQALPARGAAGAARAAAEQAADDLRAAAPLGADLAGRRSLLLAGALAVQGQQLGADRCARESAVLDRHWQQTRERVAGLEVLATAHAATTAGERLRAEQHDSDEVTSARWARRARP